MRLAHSPPNANGIIPNGAPARRGGRDPSAFAPPLKSQICDCPFPHHPLSTAVCCLRIKIPQTFYISLDTRMAK